MANYSYVARDIEGKSVTGFLSAANENAVREQLRRNNLFVTRLEAQGPSGTAGGASLFKKKVKLYDLVIYSRQLATLVRAGLPLTQAFHAMEEQTRNETLRDVTKEMRGDITSGSTLTAAMRRHAKVFSELYISLAEAGELGGMLDQTLDSAATQLDIEMEIREKVKSAFVYPIAVIVVAIGVVFFLLAYVVPIFAKVYKQFGAELPAITNSLIVISNILTNPRIMGPFVLLMIAFVIGCMRYNRTYKGRRFFDNLKISMPLFGPLIEKMALSRLAHTLSSLSDAGVPLIRALGTAGRVSGNSLLMDALADVSVKIQQGRALGATMAETKRFPLLMTRMIGAGEESGDLGGMLKQVAHFFDREVDYGVKRLMTMIEPVLTVGLGVLVGFILLALYYPIFNLGNVVK